jgi:hypothetical protein
MGIPRTLGAVSAVPGTPTPVFTGTKISAVSFSITNGVATIVLGAGNLPTNGYNGPNGYPPAGSRFDIAGPGAGSGGPAGGQQVTLWGFATATYFNGKVVSVINCDPIAGSFSFRFNHANVASTADTGSTAACPFQHYRAVRLECSQGIASTDIIYVGDLNVSSTRYVAALSLGGQLSVEIAGENIPADRIFIDATSSADSVQVSLIY